MLFSKCVKFPFFLSIFYGDINLPSFCGHSYISCMIIMYAEGSLYILFYKLFLPFVKLTEQVHFQPQFIILLNRMNTFIQNVIQRSKSKDVIISEMFFLSHSGSIFFIKLRLRVTVLLSLAKLYLRDILCIMLFPEVMFRVEHAKGM